MTPEFDRALDAYSELIIKVGLNLQSGQRLLVRAPLEAAPLVRHVAAHAYQGGARLVEVLWNDPLLLLERYRHAPRDSFAEVSQWPVNAGLEYAEAGQAFLTIIGVDPELLKDVAPELVATTRRAEGMAAMPLARLMSANAVNWCVVGYATAGWAARVFPDLPPGEQQQRLWQAIFRTVRLDAADPVAAWKAHSDQLLARTAFLNEKQYTALHFTGPGTDLVVGLSLIHISGKRCSR